MVTVKAILGDITKVTDVDAIVNAANNSLLGGGGVDGAIHRAAGPKLLKECKALHGCLTGCAKITKAYGIRVKAIIHTVGPVYVNGRSGEEDLLRRCYRRTLRLARKNGLRKIAFPSISTGVYRYPLEDASRIAVTEVAAYVSKHPDDFDLIEWVCFDEKTLEAYSQYL